MRYTYGPQTENEPGKSCTATETNLSSQRKIISFAKMQVIRTSKEDFITFLVAVLSEQIKA